jgi:hypothetical protein
MFLFEVICFAKLNIGLDLFWYHLFYPLCIIDLLIVIVVFKIKVHI